jgi:hypothetical protein
MLCSGYFRFLLPYLQVQLRMKWHFIMFICGICQRVGDGDGDISIRLFHYPNKHLYHVWHFRILFYSEVGQDSVVSVTTYYRVDSPGIKFQWGRDFLHPSSQALGPPRLLFNGYQVSFLGVMRPECGIDYALSSGAEVMERVGQSYTSIPPLGLMDCSRANFTFYLTS